MSEHKLPKRTTPMPKPTPDTSPLKRPKSALNSPSFALNTSPGDELFKQCIDCKEFKPLTEYNFKNKGRYNSACKSCDSIRQRGHYLANREERLRRIKLYRQTEAGKATVNRATYAARERNPEKELARQKLRYAVSRNKIQKQPCEKCGDVKVQAHHHLGYEPEHWYDVQWLCTIHHKEVHGFLLMEAEHYGK